MENILKNLALHFVSHDTGSLRLQQQTEFPTLYIKNRNIQVCMCLNSRITCM